MLRQVAKTRSVRGRLVAFIDLCGVSDGCRRGRDGRSRRIVRHDDDGDGEQNGNKLTMRMLIYKFRVLTVVYRLT